MGSTPSKPNAQDSQHVFSAEGPVRFSEGLVNSLQSGSETDNTRAKNLELIIQSRVASELEKHLATSQAKLSELSDTVSKEPFEPSKDKSSSSPSPSAKPLLNRLADRLTGSDGGSAQDDQDPKQKQDPNLDREAVLQEIEGLKKKLATRKKITEMDKGIQQAKEEVVACLRINDRRPLDCWKEVENFKAEVGRLERHFVEKNGS